MRKRKLNPVIVPLLSLFLTSVATGASYAAEESLNIQIATDENEFLELLKNKKKAFSNNSKITATIADANKISVDLT